MLQEVDEILREVWMECCMHLSTFTVKKNFMERTYISSEDSWDEDDGIMSKTKVSKLFEPGLVLEYKYDMGTTSYATLTCIAKFKAAGTKAIENPVLARNIQPKGRCSQCKKLKSDCMIDRYEYELICKDCFEGK